ncbi:type III secretion apparatus protein, YscD/HrpQ family [Oxalobacteraceae bacterium IMCC9480]|nr:type III secretion apparatus protein, YscD/HrpQ family [Oxalobacteraceae bacterium IMCC9480]
MDNELRILNGLHRGAALPLDDETLLLGAHEDADVVIVDPGIVAHHASLQERDGGWLLTADAGQIFSADSLAPQALLDLWAGSFFRLGETWLVISASDAAWQSMPPMPQPGSGTYPEADSDADSDAEIIPEYMAEDLFDASAETNSAFDDEDLADMPAADPDAVPVIVEAGAAAPVSTLVSRRWRKWMVAPAGLLMLLTLVAGYAYSTKPSLPALRSLQISTTIANNVDLRPPVRSLDNPVQTAAASVKLSPEGLAAAFRKRMKDADLFAQFDMDLNESGWSMRAHLDDAESARFERILKAFVVEHKITFPINAKVGSAESMLPFKIRQVVSGTNAGIVTSDGDRFYIGDEFLGVRLVAVSDNRLTFMGKRKIEVIW